jgi:hypothetical protein
MTPAKSTEGKTPTLLTASTQSKSARLTPTARMRCFGSWVTAVTPPCGSFAISGIVQSCQPARSSQSSFLAAFFVKAQDNMAYADNMWSTIRFFDDRQR